MKCDMFRVKSNFFMLPPEDKQDRAGDVAGKVDVGAREDPGREDLDGRTLFYPEYAGA